jgi:hypothetical protein
VARNKATRPEIIATKADWLGNEMSALRSNWRLLLAWLVVTAVAGACYFTPIARIFESLGD